MQSSAAAIFNALVTLRYSLVCAFTVLLYDYALTFNAEVTYVWKQRWSWGKGMFLFNRYWSLSSLSLGTIALMTNKLMFDKELTDSICHGIMWFAWISVVLWIVGVQIVLQARIYAVYSRRKRVLILLILLFILEFIVTAVLFRLSTTSSILLSAPDMPWVLQGQIKHFHGFASCARLGPAVGTADRSGFLIWIPAIAFESVLLLMMVSKTWKTYHTDWRSPLINVLLRDSFLYFFTSLAVLLVNCLISAVRTSQELHAVSAASAIAALPSCVGCRLFLNMNREYFAEKNAELPRDDTLPTFRARRSTNGATLSTVVGAV